MKKNYKSPETEIIQFEQEDVITTSGVGTMSLSVNELPIVTANYLGTDDSQW